MRCPTCDLPIADLTEPVEVRRELPKRIYDRWCAIPCGHEFLTPRGISMADGQEVKSSKESLLAIS